MVATAAAVLVLPRAASADEQSSVQAQISALRDQLTTTGQQVYRLTSGYAAAEEQVQSIGQQVAVEQVQAERAAATLAQSGAALRQELVTAYVGGVSQSSAPGAGAGVTGGDVDNPSVRLGYLSIATSGMRDSIDSYRTAQLSLNTALSTLVAEQRSAQAAAGAAGRARQAALDEAASADTRLTDLEAQLTALEDKAAAQRAAQAKQQADSSAARAGTGSQGGPVNGGLVSLVRAQVQPVAPAPAPVATTLPAVPAPVPTTSAPVTVAPTTTAPPTTVAPPIAAPSGSGSGGVWLRLRQCESGDDYQANTGNGFFGAYQFSQQTWTDLGYPGRPDLDPAAMQDAAAQKLQAESGWGQWPACSAALGLT